MKLPPYATTIKFLILTMTGFHPNASLSENICSSLGDRQNFSPVQVAGGVICFVSGESKNHEIKNEYDRNSISMFYIRNGAKPQKSIGYGLPYDGAPGKIMDVFSSHKAVEQRDAIFVIHRSDVSYGTAEPNSSATFYSVIVFEVKNGLLYQNDQATDWFGSGYGWLSDGSRVTYRYPHQSRADVLNALHSPFAGLMDNATYISARARTKVNLFDSPYAQHESKRYLAAGDRVLVKRATAGWCQLSRNSKDMSSDIWVKCESLD